MYMSPAERRAKELLEHYFNLVFRAATGKPLPSECLGEIDNIVESIIEAAVNRVMDQLKGSEKEAF